MVAQNAYPSESHLSSHAPLHVCSEHLDLFPLSFPPQIWPTAECIEKLARRLHQISIISLVLQLKQQTGL